MAPKFSLVLYKAAKSSGSTCTVKALSCYESPCCMMTSFHMSVHAASMWCASNPLPVTRLAMGLWCVMGRVCVIWASQVQWKVECDVYVQWEVELGDMRAVGGGVWCVQWGTLWCVEFMGNGECGWYLFRGKPNVLARDGGVSVYGMYNGVAS